MSAKKSPSSDTKPTPPDVIDLGPEAVIDIDRPEADSFAPEPISGSTPHPDPSTRRRSLRMVWPIVALCVGTLAGGWLYRTMLFSYFPPDQITALQAKLLSLETAKTETDGQFANLAKLAEQLKSDFDHIETGLNKSGSDTKSLRTDQDATVSRLAKVETTLTDTAKRVDGMKSSLAILSQPGTSVGTVDNSALATIAARIDALEQEVSTLRQVKSETGNATALLQSLSDLKSRLDAGSPFATELASIARAMPAADGLDVLAANADKGVANAATLGTELAALIPSLPGYEAPPAPAEKSYTDWFTGLFDGMITVKAIGVTDWQQVASEALAATQAGDLQQAIAKLDGIGSGLPAGLGDWRTRAGTRLKLDAGLARLSQAVLRQAAAKG